MGRLLGYSLPHPGHLHPLLASLAELRRRGHEIVLATDWSRPIGAPAELRRAPIAPVVLGEGEARFGGDRARVAAYRRELFTRRGRPAFEDLRRLLDAERPGFVLVDPALWGAMIAAEASGLPWASVGHSCVYLPTLGPRLVGPGAPPPANPLEKLLHQELAERTARRFDAEQLEGINALRAEGGLPRLPHAHHLYRMAPLALAFTAEPFEYPRADWHPSVRFVGPAPWDGDERADRLELAGARPLVVVASSTVEQHEGATPWVRTAIDLLAGEPLEVAAVIPTGELPRVTAPNVRLARWVRVGPLLERARCLVCHGGTGITQRALAASVPVVAIPDGYDRLEVARRVEVAGAGVALFDPSPAPDTLRGAIDLAMRSRAGAERIARAFQEAGGAAAAADAVEGLARGVAAQ